MSRLAGSSRGDLFWKSVLTCRHKSARFFLHGHMGNVWCHYSPQMMADEMDPGQRRSDILDQFQQIIHENIEFFSRRCISGKTDVLAPEEDLLDLWQVGVFKVP
jgi:hypothetical protein